MKACSIMDKHLKHFQYALTVREMRNLFIRGVWRFRADSHDAVAFVKDYRTDYFRDYTRERRAGLR